MLRLETPEAEDLDAVVTALSSWQQEGQTIQLHPGDLGWHWRFGPQALAGALRVWRRDGEIVAIGFVDTDGLIRMGISPAADLDDDVAQRLAQDVADPEAGVLPAGEAVVEARFGTAFRAALTERGWHADEPWTPLHRDLAEPVEDAALHVTTVGPDEVGDRVAVQQAAFRSTFTVERWHAMAAGTPYRQARCLVGYDAEGAAVAAVTVWSAGPGRPGVVEPMGVHRDHRGRGYGTAITIAGAAALREMGSSSATVVAEASNAGAVATYAAAGFTQLPDVPDFRRGR